MEPFEHLLHEELLHYLKSLGIIHSDIDVCAEMDDLWEKIARPYVPDAIRQWDTHQSPATTMGSMMYIGMAVAKLWQQGEQERCKMDNLYQSLYNKGGFTEIGRVVSKEVLQLTEEQDQATAKLVSDCADRTFALLKRQDFKPTTRNGFKGYLRCIRQMFIFGAAIEKEKGF